MRNLFGWSFILGGILLGWVCFLGMVWRGSKDLWYSNHFSGVLPGIAHITFALPVMLLVVLVMGAIGYVILDGGIHRRSSLVKHHRD